MVHFSLSIYFAQSESKPKKSPRNMDGAKYTVIQAMPQMVLVNSCGYPIQQLPPSMQP